MISMLQGGVMLGLLRASTSQQLQTVAKGEYDKAEGRGDEEEMNRSMAFATDYGSKVQDAMEQTEQALEETAEIASEERKAEEAAVLDKNRTEARNNPSTPPSNMPRQPQPAAILELSEDYIKATSPDVSFAPVLTEKMQGDPQNFDPKPGPEAETVLPITIKLPSVGELPYTSKGIVTTIARLASRARA